MRRLRGKLTYANVIATLALFMAMSGGVVWAAHKIGANQLKSNSVGTAKLKKNAVTAKKIKKNAVTKEKIADGSVTNSKIDEGAVDFTKIAAGTNVLGTAHGGPVGVSGPSTPLVAIPLTGTTSFTPIPGNVDMLSIEARGNLTGSGPTPCSVEVFLYVNGRAFGGGVLSLEGGSSSENPIPAAGVTVPVGLGQAGLLQQISVKATPSPECEVDSQVSVSLAVTQLK
jgi:hypothetical protein